MPQPKGRSTSRIYTPQPLDFELLAILPDQGTTVGGTFPLSRTVHSLTELLQLPAGTIGARMREMNAVGLVASIGQLGGSAHRGGHNAHGWQRTPKGAKALDDHQQNA